MAMVNQERGLNRWNPEFKGLAWYIREHICFAGHSQGSRNTMYLPSVQKKFKTISSNPIQIWLGTNCKIHYPNLSKY